MPGNRVAIGSELASKLGRGHAALIPLNKLSLLCRAELAIHAVVQQLRPSDVMKERGLRSSCPFRARMLGVLTFYDEGGPCE